MRDANRRVWWGAAAVAVGLHLLIFLAFPPFRIEPLERARHASRMVVALGFWDAPVCAGDCPPSAIRHTPEDVPPRLLNGGALNYHLARLYPPLLWKHREPTSALVEVTLGPSGAVRDAAILEGAENGTRDAVLELVRHMRFRMPDPPGRARAARFQLEIRPPS